MPLYGMLLSSQHFPCFSYEAKFLSFGFDFSHGRIKNGKYQINYVIETFNLFKVPITTTRKWMLCIFIISVFVS